MAFDATTRFVAMISGTQAGKRLPVDTEIPTPNGFIAIGDLNVGDVVFDERGIRCRVIAVTNHVVPEQCYRITFDDGVSIVADAEHQWLIQTAKQRKNQARRIINPNQLTLDTQGWPVADYTIVTTRDLLKNTILFQGKKWRSNYSIDMPMPVQYSERDLPIPPYTLGAWLGDGSRNSAGFYCADNEIIESIKSEGYPISPPKIVANQGKARTYKLGQSEWYIKSGHKSKFTSACKELGILGNKRIPKKYLTSSVGQRLALLGGLLDTDGYCCKNSQCQFYTIKQDLANDVLELTRSLGIKARLKSKTATCNGKDCGLVWTVSFTTDMPVFTVKRKLNRQMNRDKQRDDTTRRFVLKVEPVDSVDCRCIMVDSPNRLYLATRDYIVTHNTSWAPWWLLNEIRRRGRGDYGAVTASYDLFKLKLLPAIQNVFCNITGIGKYWAGDRIIEIRENASPDGRFLANRSDDVMWARIILRSAEAEGGLESGTLKAVILDEAGQPSFGRMAWSAVKRRLAIHSGRALIASTLYNCYDSETEIYTDSGWKRFDELQSIDKVYACDENGCGNFEIPSRIIWDRYIGPMISFKGHAVDLLVTPDHNMVYFHSGRMYRKTAEHLSKINYRYSSLPKTIIPEFGNIDKFVLPGVQKKHRWKSAYNTTEDIEIKMSDWCAFMGWYLSEGSCKSSNGGKIRDGMYRVYVSQNEGEDRDLMRCDLNKLPFSWSEEKDSFVTTNKQLWTYLHKLGNSSGKYIPEELKFVGRDNLLILIDRMIKGDGTINKRYGNFAYYTVSERLARDFKEVCMLAGISVGMKWRQQPDNISIAGKMVKSSFPICHIWERRRKRNIIKSHEIIDYDGYVGCVTVSTGLVLVRRNNEEIICGNCGWLKQDFIDPFDGKLPKIMKAFDNGAELRMYQNDLITLIQFDSIANPSFPMEDFELARATMPPDEFEMFWRGRAAKLRTLIYDCYEPKLHDVNDFEIPHHWPRFVGIDPLGAHIAALWIAYDPENEKLYAYREYIAPFGDTTEKHVKNILDLSAGERILAWAGGGPSERQARLDWMNYGIDLQSPTEDPALKMDVWSQIMRVYSTFRHNDMFIFKSLGNLKAELGSYQRHKDKATGEMTDRILNKEIYDGLDSLRYLICYLTDPVEQREVVYMPSIINPHMRGY